MIKAASVTAGEAPYGRYEHFGARQASGGMGNDLTAPLAAVLCAAENYDAELGLCCQER